MARTHREALKAIEHHQPGTTRVAGPAERQPVADLDMRQALLVARNEADRIRQLAAFLPGYVNRQRRITHVKQVAPRNGHGGTVPHNS